MSLIDRVAGRPSPSTQAEVGDGRGVVIYWRPGCPFCVRLRLAVRRQRHRARWVNIWEDPDAAAFVQTTNDGGHEIVPTVVIDGIAHTNPDPKLVVAALKQSA